MSGLRLFGVALAVMVGFTLAFTSADGAQAAKKKGNLTGQFKKLDTNSDGKLSLPEFEKIGKAGKEKKADKLFSKLDTNGDQFLSQDEFNKIGELKKKKNK
jgi:Ca2+-binding EF-hand superfamily protein